MLVDTSYVPRLDRVEKQSRTSGISAAKKLRRMAAKKLKEDLGPDEYRERIRKDKLRKRKRQAAQTRRGN